MKPYSIIIPVYNEAKILKNQVSRIIANINKLNLPVKYEILLIENGSTDNTCKIAKDLQFRFKMIRYIRLPKPSYGQAYKHGLELARYPYTFQFDVDFWDTRFIVKAQKLLESYDFVLGSKNLNNSQDNRTLVRKFISKLVEKLINFRFNVSVSDTHGLKALKKNMTDKFTDKVVCPNHFFDSELLIRSISEGYSFIELPVDLKEIRTSRFSFTNRFREVIRELILLMSAKITKKKPQSFSIITNVVKGS